MTSSKCVAGIRRVNVPEDSFSVAASSTMPPWLRAIRVTAATFCVNAPFASWMPIGRRG